jgi:hypothetical protein
MSCKTTATASPGPALTNSPQVPPEVRARYTSIIDSILDNADLTSITTKTIRQGIQDQVEYDITPQKVGFGSTTLWQPWVTGLTRSECYQSLDWRAIRHRKC